MKKKLLALVLVVVLAFTAVVGGTMAYLTDTDEAVNVMTLGNVQIEQLEYQRVENNGTYETAEIDGVTSYVLEPFEQAKPLYPIVGDPSKDGSEYANAGWDSTTTRLTQVGSYGGMDVFAGKNAQDKFVFVKNTGLSDAYVRTIIAFEAGSKSSAEWAEVIGYSNHFTWDTPNHIGIVNINGNNYEVVEFVYKGWGTNRHVNGVLPAGDMTYCNLAQVYMKANATNEDVEALDGNNNGTYDILVLSQAIQTAGFENAQAALEAGFGEVNAANVQSWFGSNSVPTTVSTADELAEALAAGEDVVLTESVEKDADIKTQYGNYAGYVQYGGVFDGNGETLTVDDLGNNGGQGSWGIETHGGTIKNVTIVGAYRGIVLYAPTEDVILDNVYVGGDNVGYALNTAEHATVDGIDLIVTNSTFNGWTSFAGIASASYTNCNFGAGSYYNSWPYDSLIKPYVTTTFTNCEFAAGYYLDLSSLGAGCTVTLSGCTVNGQPITAAICDLECENTEGFCVELPSWATSLSDCVNFN